MKIGTFLCWLFGHKFVTTSSRYLLDNNGFYSTWEETTTPRAFCVRCGKKKKLEGINIFHSDELLDKTANHVMDSSDGKVWKQARPIGWYSFSRRLYAVWLVLRSKADIIIWD